MYILFFGVAARRVPLLLGLLRSRLRLVRGFARLSLERSHGMFVANGADVHPSVRFPHPTSIVIGDGVVIGEGSIIYQNVTLGGVRAGDAERRAYPVVGKRVTIFCGAKVLGNVYVGDDVTIGAGAVVLKDIECGATAAGVPAKVIKRGSEK